MTAFATDELAEAIAEIDRLTKVLVAAKQAAAKRRAAKGGR